MTSIILNSITGLNYPYDIYVCDVYGNNCGYISQINTPVPASVEIVLPPPFNMAPAVGIKIITSDGCEKFIVFDCIYITPTLTPTITPTITPSITPTISLTPSNTVTPSVTPTFTPTPTITSTNTQTPTPTPTVTETPTNTPTPTPTNIPTTQTVTACDSYTWTVNGVTYTSSGTYTSGIYTLILTINNSTSSSQSETAIGSYTWPVNGVTYTTSGTYVFVGTNAAGCDDTYILFLTIN